MRTSQKIMLSAVIALSITGIFALISYTGFFRLLETDFFNSRVKLDQMARLENISETISLWNQENLSRFGSLSRDRNMQSVFSVSQRQEEILYRAQLSDSLKDQLLGFNGMRIVDNSGRIQFSSFAGDISSSQSGVYSRILYRNWNDTSESFELPFADEDSIASTYYDEANQLVRYQLPIEDWGFVTRGWMVVYMDLSGLTDRLARDGSIAQGANLYIVEGRGIIASIRPEQFAEVKEEINSLWPVNGAPAGFSVLAKGLDEKYWLAGTISSDGSWVGKLVPGQLFGLSDFVQITIFATVFLTSILLAFLLLNLRQDRMEVLRERIKKLQANLLRDWMEHHEDRKLLLKELEARQGEVRVELKSGLGKLKEEQSAKADEIIDEGWNRIARILAEKEFDVEGASMGNGMQQMSIDMKLLEDMISRAISTIHIAIPQIEQARKPLQATQRAISETEEIAEVVEELVEPEEIHDVREEDTELEELTELESDETDDTGELVSVQGMESSDYQTTLEYDNEKLPRADASEVIEILPVVLADDFGELVEINDMKRSKLYMFDRAPDSTHEDS